MVYRFKYNSNKVIVFYKNMFTKFPISCIQFLDGTKQFKHITIGKEGNGKD